MVVILENASYRVCQYVLKSAPFNTHTRIIFLSCGFYKQQYRFHPGVVQPMIFLASVFSSYQGSDTQQHSWEPGRSTVSRRCSAIYWYSGSEREQEEECLIHEQRGMNGTARFKRSTVIHKQKDASLLVAKFIVMEKDIRFLPCLSWCFHATWCLSGYQSQNPHR